jgi:hypothetical protein
MLIFLLPEKRMEKELGRGKFQDFSSCITEAVDEEYSATLTT